MQFNIKRFVCHYIVISDILWILQKKWLFFEIWKFPHIFYWWSLEDNFLKILVFDIIPLIFPLWPAAKKTWLQLSLGNPCTLYNFICIIIHITSNADALWACHAVFLKNCMTSTKNICVGGKSFILKLKRKPSSNLLFP